MLERRTPDISSLNNLDSSLGYMPPQPAYGYHHPPRERRYLSSFSVMALTVIAILISIVAWEKLAPYDLKISVQLGTFSGTTAAAMLDAQQDIRLEYEGKLKEQQEVLQTNVAKQQTELQMQVTLLQAELQRVNQAYSAMYQRGNMIAQSVAQAQQQFLNLRQQLAANGQGGAVAAANTAGLIGGLIDVFGGQENQYMAQQFYSKADEINRRNRSSYDESASTPAPFIQIQGWNEGLPSPNEFMNMTNDIAAKMIQINGQTTASNPFERRSYDVTPNKF